MSYGVVAFGSNLGDRNQNIADAIRMLDDSSDGTTVIKVSTIIETTPVGMNPNVERFLNGALCVETDMSLDHFFSRLCDIEAALGRCDKGLLQSRPIDLDIIFWNHDVIRSDRLIVPHPRFRNRSFVLNPLDELNGAFVDPITYKTIAQLKADFDTGNSWYCDEDHISGCSEWVVCSLRAMNKQPLVIGLEGDLGCGKTTLVRDVTRYLGVSDVVASPTFDLVRRYESDNMVIIHSDLYRLNMAEAACIDLDLDVEANPKWVFVEWHDRLPLGSVDLVIKIMVLGSRTRHYVLQKNSPNYHGNSAANSGPSTLFIN